MNSWTEFAELLSQLPLIDAVNATKKQLDDIRPLPQEVEGRVMQKLRLEWNYHSNAIEGNKLTRGETYTFLMQGLTAKAKPYKDHQDIKGHNKGIDFLFDLVKDQRDLTEGDIRDLHTIILVEPYKNPALTPDGQETTRLIQLGKYKTQPNFPKTATGEIHYYAMPEETPILMQELVDWYNQARHNERIHPSVLAAFVHHRFVEIHPFDDGNGRLGRMLMNLILIKRGYPPVIIKQNKQDEYYAILSQADKKEYTPLVEFMAESLLDSMNLYLKAARGESIEDDADLDKEIALFKGSFEKTYHYDNSKVVPQVVKDIFIPICEKGTLKLNALDDLFLSKDVFYVVNGSYTEFEEVETDFGLQSHHSEIDYEDRFSDLSKLFEHIENGIDVRFFDYCYKWSKFNKSSYTFNFLAKLCLRFEHTYFQIDFGDYKLLSKYYGEPITDAEKQKIAIEWARLTFENLKKKIEEVNKT